MSKPALSKSTEQQTTFTNTIADMKRELAVERKANAEALRMLMGQAATIARLNEALDIAEHGLVVSNGLQATDKPLLKQDPMGGIALWADAHTHWRIDNAADLAKIRELRG